MLIKKLFSLKWHAAAQVHELKSLFLELTHKCNLRCIHCGSDCLQDSQTPNLPFQEIVRVLDQIRQSYNPNKICLIFSGGEPLLYPRVFELGKKAIELGFPWGMVSNGYAWNARILKKAKEAGMQSITISLDGLEEEHNWMRGKKDSFKRAVQSIKLLVAAPFYQDMDIITCVNKRNLNSLDEIYQLLKTLGIQKWRLFLVSPIGRAKEHQNLFLSSKEMKQLFDKVIELKAKQDIEVNMSEAGYYGKQYETKVRDFRYHCTAGINVGSILINGDISACPNIDRRFAQGNIYQDSFVKTWEERFEVFRDRNWMKQGPCLQCKDWDFCKGHCFHLWDKDNQQSRICYLEHLDKE